MNTLHSSDTRSIFPPFPRDRAIDPCSFSVSFVSLSSLDHVLKRGKSLHLAVFNRILHQHAREKNEENKTTTIISQKQASAIATFINQHIHDITRIKLTASRSTPNMYIFYVACTDASAHDALTHAIWLWGKCSLSLTHAPLTFSSPISAPMVALSLSLALLRRILPLTIVSLLSFQRRTLKWNNYHWFLLCLAHILHWHGRHSNVRKQQYALFVILRDTQDPNVFISLQTNGSVPTVVIQHMSHGHVHNRKNVDVVKLQDASYWIVKTTNRDGMKSSPLLMRPHFLLSVVLTRPPPLFVLLLPRRLWTFLSLPPPIPLLARPISVFVTLHPSIPSPSPVTSHVRIAWCHPLFNNIWIHNPSHDVHRRHHRHSVAHHHVHHPHHPHDRCANRNWNNKSNNNINKYKH